jgi:hypothetical protein
LLAECALGIASSLPKALSIHSLSKREHKVGW